MNRIVLAALLLLSLAHAPIAAQAPIPDWTEEQLKDAKALLEGIKKAPRGPFGEIRWYCKDGRVLPPQGTPCGKGQGFQHAAPSAAALKLEQYNVDVTRFLAGMPVEKFFDEARNHYWLREMVLLEYLINYEDGWIYRGTWARRGVRQQEDEVKEARRLLLNLAARSEWVERNYLLFLQAASVAPHELESSDLRRIRAISTSLAEQDSRFQPIRGKIHSRPGEEDISAVEQFVREKEPADASGYEELLGLLKRHYSTEQLSAVLARYYKLLAGLPIEKDIAATQSALARDPQIALAQGAELSVALRRAITARVGEPGHKLAMTDLNNWLLDAAFRASTRREAVATSRKGRLEEIRTWLRYATGAGLLSFRQLTAIEDEMAKLMTSPQHTTDRYRESVRYVERSVDWSRAAALREFGEVERHFSRLEPKAAGLIDDVLRRSVVLELSRRIEVLVADAEAATNRRHFVLGRTERRGVAALNPGIAIGGLEVVEPGSEESTNFLPSRIYVIPSTLADLKPVRGILTLDSGNALSHAQILAANLGIPNATVPSSLLDDLRAHRGKDMFYAVTPGGTVVLRPWSELSEEEKARWKARPAQVRQRIKLDMGRLDMEDRKLRTLEEVSRADSGVRAGPKAANLGELRRYFSNEVAPGIVIPFGVFQAHVTRKPAGGGPSLAERIQAAYREAETLRSSGQPVEKVREFINPKLAEFRKEIQSMPLLPEFEQELSALMDKVFGPDGSYGVFVRSDTNAEDLPEFTGAGLNLTVPNQVGRKNIFQAIGAVWASPLAERAYEWRSQILDPAGGSVYPSVLLLRTVPADKSGVLATANLDTLDQRETTVNASEGVAAVVDGGVAESLLLRPDGSVRLLAQSRAPYRRVALPTGGFEWRPTSGADVLIQKDEVRQLRDMVSRVKEKYPAAKDESGAPMPFDIEFGFEKGQLRLFQIRPLVRYREAKVLESLASLDAAPAKAVMVRLDESIPEP